VVPFLRRCTALQHKFLGETKGKQHSNKALAHTLLALGELQVPFERVYPLVLLICSLLQERVKHMDLTYALGMCMGVLCALPWQHCPMCTYVRLLVLLSAAV
jgi:hypothetical protein